MLSFTTVVIQLLGSDYSSAPHDAFGINRPVYY